MALRSGCQQACRCGGRVVRTQPCAHHTLGIAGWHCCGTLVSPPRFSPARSLQLSTPRLCRLLSLSPLRLWGRGRVTGMGSRPGGVCPTRSKDIVFCMGDPLCSPYGGDLPTVCPSSPLWELSGGPVGGSVWGQPPQHAGNWATAGRRPPRQLQAGIELLCLEPFRH